MPVIISHYSLLAPAMSRAHTVTVTVRLVLGCYSMMTISISSVPTNLNVPPVRAYKIGIMSNLQSHYFSCAAHHCIRIII